MKLPEIGKIVKPPIIIAVNKLINRDLIISLRTLTSSFIITASKNVPTIVHINKNNSTDDIEENENNDNRSIKGNA